jgi:hypothetical protein
MANTLIYTVVQYEVNNLPQRLIAKYVDDAQDSKSEIMNRDNMTSPDAQIFDNFKTQIEQHVASGGTLTKAVVQYGVEGIDERMIVQYITESSEEQQILNRADMDNPDAQIFDNFKNLVEQHMI